MTFSVSYRVNTDSIIEIIIFTNTRSKPFSITAAIKYADTQNAKSDKIMTHILWLTKIATFLRTL